MRSETQRLNDAERANLVAYLDGELIEAEFRALQAKIELSVTAKREIESLQKTWDLLDCLDRPQPDPTLTTRTMTIAIDEASRGGRTLTSAINASRMVAGILTMLGVASICLLVGYVSSRWIWPDPSSRLANDLPIAEHFQEYREVGSFEFLKLLDNSPAFGEDKE